MYFYRLLFTLALVGWFQPGQVYAQAKRNQVSLDLFAFGQRDDDKDKLRNTSFNYAAAALAARIQVTDVIAIRGNATLSLLFTDGQPEFPETIKNAEKTRASPDIQILDSALSIDIKPKGSAWTLSLGGYYHHQFGFISPGFDLSVQGELFGGDTVLYFSYSIRPSVVHLRYWDDRERGEDIQLSNTFLIGWTQTLHPRWVMSLSAQYARQDGLLRRAFGFVALVNDEGEPVLFSDETVPRTRNRVQLNARIRFSPLLGMSLGLDVSGYYDDWDVLHGGIQLNLEFPIARWLRWRVWYRIAAQRQSKFFVGLNKKPLPMQTQDNDLGSFIIHAPGMLFLFPLGATGRISWVLRIAGIGFYRDDGIFAIGAKLGVAARW